jgi:hypothetical protein
MGRRHPGVDRLFIGDIQGRREDLGPGCGQLGRGIFQLHRVSSTDRHLSSLGGEGFRNALPDSLIGPGDQGHFASESIHNERLSRCRLIQVAMWKRGCVCQNLDRGLKSGKSALT